MEIVIQIIGQANSGKSHLAEKGLQNLGIDDKISDDDFTNKDVKRERMSDTMEELCIFL